MQLPPLISLTCSLPSPHAPPARSYVTGLPEDVTEAELVETFSKCGVIKEDLDVRPAALIGLFLLAADAAAA